MVLFPSVCDHIKYFCIYPLSYFLLCWLHLFFFLYIFSLHSNKSTIPPFIIFSCFKSLSFYPLHVPQRRRAKLWITPKTGASICTRNMDILFHWGPHMESSREKRAWKAGNIDIDYHTLIFRVPIWWPKEHLLVVCRGLCWAPALSIFICLPKLCKPPLTQVNWHNTFSWGSLDLKACSVLYMYIFY